MPSSQDLLDYQTIRRSTSNNFANTPMVPQKTRLRQRPQPRRFPFDMHGIPNRDFMQDGRGSIMHLGIAGPHRWPLALGLLRAE
jgi:hypothetical protein